MTWGNNLTNMHLLALLKKYQSLLAKKQAVIERHEQGTPYHTRASREAQAARERIKKIETILNDRAR